MLISQRIEDVVFGQLLGSEERVLRLTVSDRLPGLLVLATALGGIHRNRLRRPSVLDALQLVVR